jgi:uncharacterized membrane protein
MMSMENLPPGSAPPHPKRKKILTPLHFVVRGLAISLPSILTVVILLWLLRGINTYIVYPATSAVTWVMAQYNDRSVDATPLVGLSGGPPIEGAGRNYVVTPELRNDFQDELNRRAAVPNSPRSQRSLDDWVESQRGVFVPYGDRAVPYEDYLVVSRKLHANDMPRTATGLYMEWSVERSFGSVFQLSLVALILIVILLYFLGRLVTVRLGHWFVSKFETGVLGRLPVIRNVYGSVKQVTDFLFSENQVEYRRVVAVEYPRRGIWSLGLVTGDSMLDITAAVGEPCLTVLVPSSPMPVTGYTMSVPRSHVLDLDITVEHAMQFCISCGVLVPKHQRATPELLREHLEKRFAEGFTSGASRARPQRSDDDDGPPRLYGNGSQPGTASKPTSPSEDLK